MTEPSGGGASGHATPPRARGTRAAENDTPHDRDRPSQAPRRTPQPEALNFGHIDVRATEDLNGPSTFEGPRGLVPQNSHVLTKISYKGRKDHLGSNVICLTKTQAHALVCACWYMAPEELGGEVVRELSKKAVSKGEASSFSERLKGFTWIGYDRNNLTRGEDAIRKAGWINTTTSAGSAEAVMDSVKQLGAELIRANLPMDLYVVEMKVSDAVAKKLKVKLSILQRNVSIDTSEEKDDDSGTQPEA